MAGIIKREFHVFAAESFVDELNTEGNQENNVYLGIGRNAVWGDEANPDVPVDSGTDKTDFWNNILALSLVNPTNVSLVVPKKTWTTGATTYKIFDVASTSAVAFADDFYVVNSENRVYEITTAPGDPVSNPTSVEPIGASNVIDQGDGYAYRFLYTIEIVDQKFITDNWMPVEFEVNYDPADPVGNHIKLGAKYVLVFAKVSSGGGGIIPVTSAYDYRQISIMRNLLLNDNSDNELKAKASAAEYIDFTSLNDGSEPTKVVRELGELMYLENRRVVARNTGQSEEIKLILEF